MSERLRESLRTAAGGVPAYDVYDTTLRTVTRRRRRRISAWCAAAAVAGVLVVSGLPVPRSPGGPAVAAQGPSEPSLPDAVGVPSVLNPGLGLFPAGPAALVMGGWGPNDSGDTAVVGAERNLYRTFTVNQETFPGSEMLLSPDGSTLAVAGARSGRGVELIDLSTGDGEETAGAEPFSEYTVPLAWSPTGEFLAVRTMARTGSGADGLVSTWGLVNVRTGEYRRGGSNDQGDPVVAFTPDGQRLAYQGGAAIQVYGLDLRRLTGSVPSGFGFLAGKGAWTPDGSALMILQPVQAQEGQGSGAAEGPGPYWALRTWDPSTGAQRAGAPRWLLPAGVAGVRLLGWNPQGEPVAVLFAPEPDMPVPDQRFRTHPGETRSISVVALRPGGQPRLLLAPPEPIDSIDIADGVIRGGRLRTGAQPPSYLTMVLAGIVLVGTVWGVAVLRRNRRRERHWADPVG